MAKGYWVVHLEVSDPGAYGVYRDFVRPFLDRNGGRFVIRGGRQIVAEGSVAPRNNHNNKNTKKKKKKKKYSPEYQEGLKLRSSVSQAHFAIVEGLED